MGKWKEKYLGNNVKLAILTVIMIVFIVGGMIVCGIGRKGSDISVNSFSEGVHISTNGNLNAGEVQVLELISANRMVVADNAEEENQFQSLYISILKNYLSDYNVNLSDSKVERIKKLLENYSATKMNIDNKQEHLSLISKGIILSVSRQIYKQCGLNLYCDLQGNIQFIKDGKGNVLYKLSNQSHQRGMKWRGFICICIICSILIGIGYVISKKQRLFKKGGLYHGYKEKEFA